MMSRKDWSFKIQRMNDDPNVTEEEIRKENEAFNKVYPPKNVKLSDKEIEDFLAVIDGRK